MVFINFIVFFVFFYSVSQMFCFHMILGVYSLLGFVSVS